jgi:hypothetical protein
MAKQMHRHRPMRHHHHMTAKKWRRHAAPEDSMTDQLNREELSRLQGGGAPMAPPPQAPPQAPSFSGPRPSGAH